MSDKNALESAYDKTKEMASKAGEMTKEAASNVRDYVTGDDRTKTEKTWDEAKDHLSKGAEKATECSAQKAREARDYVAEKTHEAANQIQG